MRLGRSLRTLRKRRGWTQERLGAAARLSRETISRLESGDVGGMRVDTVARCVEALGSRLDMVVRWRGEGLDRLLDAGHAALVERTVMLLRDSGWQTVVEATFAHYGERGSVDVLALHAATGTILVVEVKSVVPDMQEMLAGLDRKARLAPFIAAQHGWGPPSTVSRLLVIPAGRTERRRLSAYRAMLASALPDRGTRVRARLRDPGDGSLAGILTWPDSRGTTVRPRAMPRSADRSAGSGHSD